MPSTAQEPAKSVRMASKYAGPAELRRTPTGKVDRVINAL